MAVRRERLEVGETSLRSGHSLSLRSDSSKPSFSPVRSELLDRVASFLPTLKSANEATLATIATEGRSAVDVEEVGEDEAHIAMDVALVADEESDDSHDDDSDDESADDAPTATLSSADPPSGAATLSSADPLADAMFAYAERVHAKRHERSLLLPSSRTSGSAVRSAKASSGATLIEEAPVSAAATAATASIVPSSALSDV